MTSTVQASTTEGSQTQPKLSLSAQKKLDPYVTVKNNHYVLGENAKRVVSEEYNVAKQVIAQTNVTVENLGSVINKDINLRGRHLIGWGC
ncbi:hypothetical protein [Lactobacillus delbrueckii]|uniref:hypothetical protein n=1 Tax=Lactobacillus delbrueckii TaxID=1584 RepID=UPI0018C8B3E4|nr:hypothetical protein [Lactobacillus delbrueckii]